MGNVVNVGISDFKTVTLPDSLVTFALGSCIGICLYDPVTKVAGLAHIMLPNAPASMTPSENPMKYADTCLPLLVRKMQQQGGSPDRLVAKIAGGARMFEVLGDSSFGNIGERNIQSVRAVLRNLRIRVTADDTGFNYARTVYFHSVNGSMEVKSFSKETKIL